MLPLAYIAKSTAILGILLLYYHWILKKQTFFNLNRIYLLGSVIFAVCIPFIQIKLNENVSTFPVLPANFLQEIEISTQSAHVQENSNGIYDYIVYVYWIGVCLFSLQYLAFWGRLFWLKHKYPHKKFKGIHFTLLNAKYIPTFSVFNYLFINTIGISRENQHKIFEHEKIHIRHLHSLDLHLLSILCIFNWFNPLLWIFKKAISQNHEYIADRQVIGRYQTGSYLQLLVGQTLKGNFSFSNGFSCSNLKKRMIMMTQKQTSRFRIWNYIPAFLLSGVLFVSFCCTVTGKPAIAKPAELLSETIKALSVQAQDTVGDNAIFQIVEEMPKFNGDAIKWVNQHVKYPVKAIEQSISGKVLVSFVISKTGAVKDVRIAKGADPVLNEEALRVIKAMPAWTPGKQKGKVVNVAYTIPVNFSISKTDDVIVTAYGSEKKQDAKDIFTIVEDMPKFKGDIATWLQEHIQMPVGVDLKEAARTYVSYVVFEDGTLHDIKIAKSSGNTALDNEALRVINAMPAWTPGKQRGNFVKVSYLLPIVFSPGK